MEDYNSIKKMAKEMGCKVNNFLAESIQNDPRKSAVATADGRKDMIKKIIGGLDYDNC